MQLLTQIYPPMPRGTQSWEPPPPIARSTSSAPSSSPPCWLAMLQLGNLMHLAAGILDEASIWREEHEVMARAMEATGRHPFDPGVMWRREFQGPSYRAMLSSSRTWLETMAGERRAAFVAMVRGRPARCPDCIERYRMGLERRSRQVP